MALTQSRKVQLNLGSADGVHVILTFAVSYPTGGEPLTARDLGLGEIRQLIVDQGEDGLVAKYDYTNEKLQLFESAGVNGPLLEVGNGSNQSGVVVRVTAIGLP